MIPLSYTPVPPNQEFGGQFSCQCFQAKILRGSSRGDSALGWESGNRPMSPEPLTAAECVSLSAPLNLSSSLKGRIAPFPTTGMVMSEV